MVDNNSIRISVGDSVKHRHREKYPIGTVAKIEDGCNAICWVDFGELVLGKAHLTICTKYDIVKTK